MDVEFEDFEVRSGPWTLVWEWIGEGESGDYDPDDPDDVPRLRASLYIGETQVDSYCTLATPKATAEQLTVMAHDLFCDLPSNPIVVGEYVSGVKGPMSRWTWRTNIEGEHGLS